MGLVETLIKSGKRTLPYVLAFVATDLMESFYNQLIRDSKSKESTAFATEFPYVFCFLFFACLESNLDNQQYETKIMFEHMLRQKDNIRFLEGVEKYKPYWDDASPDDKLEVIAYHIFAYQWGAEEANIFLSDGNDLRQWANAIELFTTTLLERLLVAEKLYEPYHKTR